MATSGGRSGLNKAQALERDHLQKEMRAHLNLLPRALRMMQRRSIDEL